MFSSCVLFILLCIIVCITAFQIPRFPKRTTPLINDLTPPRPQFMWIDQTIDHFDMINHAHFQQQVLVYDEFYTGEGPMFFYTGNEGDIMDFYNNTGLMFELGQQYNALIIFAEHRYYGKSLPFGDNSFTRENIQYLTVEQALADYIYIIQQYRRPSSQEYQPVITFGGSYGGMLSSWIRIKYPGVIDGAIAASAPVLQYQGYINPEEFSHVATNTFASAGVGCDDAIREGFSQIISLGRFTSGLKQLEKDFKLCESISNTDKLISFITTAYQYGAMVDYPYPNSFLQPVPAHPVNVMCSMIKHSDDNVNMVLLSSIADAVGVYYNTTGNQQCFNLSQTVSDNLGMKAWDYQYCTELALPTAQDGVNDMFLPVQEWNINQLSEYCKLYFGVVPNTTWIPDYTGAPYFNGVSNIVFSNGDLDPWIAGGVTQNIGINNDITIIVIKDGAHHLDLRFSDKADPDSVIQARRLESDHIQLWIDEAVQKHTK